MVVLRPVCSFTFSRSSAVGAVLMGAAISCAADPPSLAADDGATETDADVGTTSDAGSASQGDTSDPVPDTGSMETGDSGAEGTEPTDDTGEGTGGDVPLRCVEGVLDPAEGGQLVDGVDLEPASNDFSGSCGGDQARDLAFEWRVPATDFYALDTQGSTFDTVLYLLDGACDGPEIACNQDAPDGVYSRLVAPFEAGQRIVAVLDGALDASGEATLNISRVACPNATITDADLPLQTSNVGGASAHGGDCGGADGAERSFHYTAPESGLYSFRATSEDFTASVYVEEGPECGGTLLGCNAAIQPLPAEVIRELDAGQTVTVIVDSQSGAGMFELDIGRIEEACPFGEISSVEIQTGDIQDFPHVMTGSCGPSGDLGTGNPAPSATYSFTAIDGAAACWAQYDGGFQATVSVMRSDCGGEEVACEVFNEPGDDDRYGGQVFIEEATGGTEWVMTVTAIGNGQIWTDAQFEVSFTCALF